jgi:hypothetical protein
MAKWLRPNSAKWHEGGRSLAESGCSKGFWVFADGPQQLRLNALSRNSRLSTSRALRGSDSIRLMGQPHLAQGISVIVATQAVEHYEMSRYGTLMALRKGVKKKASTA